ncbi:MAG: PDZ domain-containing protein, partial [Actinobacteria bacterium]|nr:PDZ domain-containing protein [Actinomycetota bacterium]
RASPPAAPPAAPPASPTAGPLPAPPAATGPGGLRPIARAPRWHRAFWWFAGPLLVVVLAAVAVGTFAPSPYVELAPGSARPVEGLVSLPATKDADRTPTGAGDLLFLTVTVRQATWAEALRGWLDSDVDVFPRRLIYGDQSRTQNRKQNLQLMDTSKLVAASVALRQLGYRVAVTGTGVQVTQVSAGVPAAAVLRAGDVVVEADGRPVRIDSDLTAAISGKAPGDTMRLVVERGGRAGARRTVSAKLAPRPEDPSRAMLGVVIQNRGLRYELPFKIDIATGDVGGPSAGLAFTLAIIDRLSPGRLTAGRKVAVTGEMSPDGRVLEVGGVAQKAVAARKAGAEMMLVPTNEAPEARRHAGPIEIVPVATLRDALRALARAGGRPALAGDEGAQRPGG